MRPLRPVPFTRGSTNETEVLPLVHYLLPMEASSAGQAVWQLLHSCGWLLALAPTAPRALRHARLARMAGLLSVMYASLGLIALAAQ